MDAYTVKLWITNAKGFREQIEVVISVPSADKSAHTTAETIALLCFRKNRPEIISVKYQ